MARRTPVDQSRRWPRCGRPGCGATHLPEYDCPAVGVWLVARFCPACTSSYCRRHSQREYGRPILTVVRSQRNRTGVPMTFTYKDLESQVLESMVGHEDNFDVAGIAEQIREVHGVIPIDDIPSDQYWLIVQNHVRDQAGDCRHPWHTSSDPLREGPLDPQCPQCGDSA